VAYDAMNIFLKGLDEGNTTPEKMLEFINGVTYEGVANTYKFTSTGELDSQYIKVWAFKFDANGVDQPDQEIKTS
jgi:branched-chain amino acid transport system substrate-binding protein